MAENDNAKKPHYPRRNAPQRPLPGVQKAINNFGVSDLRQLLDQKHKEEKPIDPKNIPPPDPSYNYLRDPARDKPRASQPHKSKPKNQENSNKTKEIIAPENENAKITNFRGRYPRRGNLNLSRDNQTTNESNFRGGSSRRGRGNGRPKTKDNPETIIDLINIKIEVSSETGHRSCILDEETKIADIKHVPDHQFSSPRRGRGFFRGRGRGRGFYRGRAGFNNNKNINQDSATEEEIFEEAQGNENKLSSEYNEDSEAQFDSNLAETITVTSSKLPDSEIERLVEVTLENNTNE
ncbi:unnamed protein product [Ceutorhynchus assimilis]|uniref:Uncharacterized protein n=1 Tax=Ceutorhynchus assimilis TaxID=467358 RepID=A0A9N9MC64_9CUCU|nr:unnamed protein product [Ceutorhynchus assimilis]